MTQSNINFRDLAMPGVRDLAPYEPGKPTEEVQREYGLAEVTKLASNENPLGASPAAVAAIRERLDEVAIYPDGNGYALKQALAARFDVPFDGITLGDGSDNLMQLLASVFLGPGRNAVMSRHGFASYPIVTRTAGAEMHVAAPNATDHPMPYGHDLDAMHAMIDADTRIVFVANPNNPTGTWLKRDELTRFLDAVPSDVVVVLDEAYFEYVEEPEYPDGARLLAHYPNLVVLHTFSKVYGLAALRIGYALSSPALADLMNRVRLPFNVNTFAQVAALASLTDTDHVRKTVALNREQRAVLGQALTERGLAFIPSVGNFLTVDVRRDGRAVFEQLLRQGVIVRPLVNYGLPTHLRVTIGLPEQNRRFLSALDRVLGLA